MTDRDFVFPLKLAPTVSCLSFISHPSKSISAQRPHQCCGLKVYISPRIHHFFFLSKSQAVSTWTSFILAQKALSCKRNSKKGPHAQTSMSVVKYTLSIFTGVHMRGPHMHIYRHFLSCHLFKCHICRPARLPRFNYCTYDIPPADLNHNATALSGCLNLKQKWHS